ncbi:MAG: glyoxylate/hydroxypyruvate reductase A [Paracoccaceae bacterium]|jgi:glyoxylate/hydroxypyruvate reductase A
MIKILFAAQPSDWLVYEKELISAFSNCDLKVQLTTDVNAYDVEYIIYSPSCDIKNFQKYPRLKAVMSLWAGVEHIANNPTIDVPLCRMVDMELTDGMVEYVTGHVLRYHLGLDFHTNHQDGVWRNEVVPPLAKQRNVCILGLGELGTACAIALTNFKFNVCGWSRTKRKIHNVRCYHGVNGYVKALTHAEILVLLLPLTSSTSGILDSASLSHMPEGAMIINPGRGHLIEDEALINSINEGHIRHATLDVFREEPLPPDHFYWNSNNVTVTPHIASTTRVKSASESIAANIKIGESGKPFLHAVNRQQGY